jgi:hypothetical protein
MTQLKIALSFDHELSLGGADCYQRNLFEPTEHLFQLAADLKVPLVLFTDIWSAIRFREWDASGFYQPYEMQVGRALHLGHDVQLHIHPHWVDSEFSEGTFVPSNRYCLAAFQNDAPPDDIPGILRRGCEALTELCQTQRHDYRCIAYRGGGLNLAPQTAAILRGLHDLGIRIDSSIAKGWYFQAGFNSVDYRKMPRLANWFISPDQPLNQAASRGLFEVPIASKPRNVVNNVPFLIRRFFNRHHIYRSTGWTIEGSKSSWSDRLARLVPQSVWTVSFDSYARTAEDVCDTLRYHVRQHRSEDVIFCAACSHPKFMGPYQRDVMAHFVEWTRAEYQGAVEFVTFRQIYDDLGLGDSD